MLAIQNKFRKLICSVGCFALCTSFQVTANAQQPSQRYTPVRAVPQVHVPATGFRQIQEAPTRRQTQQQSHPQFRDPNVRPTSYTFSDQNVDVPEILAGGKPVLPSIQLPEALDVPKAQLPDALQKAADRVQTTQQAISEDMQFNLPTVDSSQFRPAAIPSQPLNQFRNIPAPQMILPEQDFGTWRSPAAADSTTETGPRVAPSEIDLAPIKTQQPLPKPDQLAQLDPSAPDYVETADMQKLRDEIQEQKDAIAAQKIALEEQRAAAAVSQQTAAQFEESARLANEERMAIEAREREQARRASEYEAARIAAEKEAERLASEQMKARQEADEQARIAAQERQARIDAEEQAKMAANARQEADQQAARIAAEEKAKKIADERARMVALREQMKNQAPLLRAKPLREIPVSAPNENETNEEYVAYQPAIAVQPIATEPIATEPIVQEPAPQQQPELSLRAPAIQVDTYGPRSIGINKVGTYKVVIQNQSDFEAENVRVGIALPNWIDVRNINLTSGTRTVEETERTNELNWIVPRIAANSDQTLIIEAVPTKAEKFDIGIEWTLVPRVASASVAVTEPRLEMKISGPSDVLYGEKAVYHVVVRNPGTGTAESVVVKLPEALGGDRAQLHDILPGEEKNFQVELFARTSGELDLSTIAVADGDLQTAAGRKIMVRRAKLDVQIEGPGVKYSGTDGKYTVTVTNSGDAAARNVVSGVDLPPGVKYLGGIDSVTEVEDTINWSIGTLDQGDSRTYSMHCELNADGNLQFDAGVRGDGDLAATHAMITAVETVADLVLTVEDPKGPLPTGENVDYTIKIRNRGSRAAMGVSVVMQYSEGIEPISAEGLKYTIDSEHGQVLFSSIPQVDPGEEVTLIVRAIPENAGTHVFRAQLTCTESDSREVAEGTTRFYGDEIQSEAASTANSTNGLGLDNQFQR